MKMRGGIEDMFMGFNLTSSSSPTSNLIPTHPFNSNGYGNQRDGNYRGHNNQRTGFNNYNNQRSQYKHNQTSNNQYNRKSFQFQNIVFKK